MVLGSITKMAVIAWGILFLHDAAGPFAILGALLSVAGGFAYSRKEMCGPRGEESCLPSASASWHNFRSVFQVVESGHESG